MPCLWRSVRTALVVAGNGENELQGFKGDQIVHRPSLERLSTAGKAPAGGPAAVSLPSGIGRVQASP